MGQGHGSLVRSFTHPTGAGGRVPEHLFSGVIGSLEHLPFEG
jgi:hypothetical protein